MHGQSERYQQILRLSRTAVLQYNSQNLILIMSEVFVEHAVAR
jgi:hypothetical protein